MNDKSASEQIDDIIKMHNNWKGQTLVQIRTLLRQADPCIVEEVKWKMATRPEGLPVWSHNGILCFAETWKDNVKLLFPKGAQLKDPKKLFNARLASKTNRAIEFKEDSNVDGAGLKDLITEALEANS
jgi:hypothetical protein